MTNDEARMTKEARNPNDEAGDHSTWGGSSFVLRHSFVIRHSCFVIIRRQRASVLVGLLWCVALLSVMVIGVLHSSTLDLRVAKTHGDTIQAHYLALAGIEKAKALLYQDAAARKRSAKNHSGDLYDAPQAFKDVRLGRGQFRVFHQGRREENGKILYGISDEESRLNVNSVKQNELANLYKMTPEVMAAIMDWRDGNHQTTPNGAETDYYASLQPPYVPRNGPLQTVRELLMVKGVTRDLLLGEDVNQNGLLDPEEDDGRVSFPDDNHDGILDNGWSGVLTVDSMARNESAAGQQRIDIKSADERALSGVPGISQDLAKAIIAYRGQKQFENIADLLDVTAINPQQQNRTSTGVNQPGAGSGRGRTGSAPPVATQTGVAPSGPKLISETMLMDMGDDVATSSDEEQPGAININTASAEVLACVPGVSQELAQAIVAYRQSAGYFPNIAWLLKVDGMNSQIFKQMVPKVCARSQTFRILSEGTVNSTGARKRVEVVVRLGAGEIETLAYREDL
jgi:competence ComEA-like helix-hairpin-helix protein